MLRSTILTISAASCVFALAGCTTVRSVPNPDSVAAQESESQEAESSDTVDPALKIEKPKDLKGIDDACTMLKPDQLAKLQQDDQEPNSELSLAGSQRCTWFGDKYSTIVSLGANHDVGPAQLRENAKSADNFNPIEVDGYPGVQVDDQGTMCRVEIGVADDQFFTVNYTKLGGKEPVFQRGCEFAEKIASEVLKNLPDA